LGARRQDAHASVPTSARRVLEVWLLEDAAYGPVSGGSSDARPERRAELEDERLRGWYVADRPFRSWRRSGARVSQLVVKYRCKGPPIRHVFPIGKSCRTLSDQKQSNPNP
jgi:hypothetical protein